MDGGNRVEIEIRPGTIEDLPVAFELLQRMHAEVGEAPIDLELVATRLAAVLRDGFLIMAYAPAYADQPAVPAGTLGLRVDGWWYAGPQHRCLRDAWTFVDRPFRGMKVLDQMVDAAKVIADGMELRLYLGAIGADHIEAKERILGRCGLGKAGVLFEYRPPGS